MPAEYLTKELFEARMAAFDQRLTEALDLRETVTATATDVAVLKDRSERAHRFAISGLVASGLSLIGNFFMYRTGH